MSNELIGVGTQESPTLATDRKLVRILVSAIVDNRFQSRGMGVLPGVLAKGWRAFPNDPEAKGIKKGVSVVGELVSGDSARQASMLNLLREEDSEPVRVGEDTLWTMADSIQLEGQITPIRVFEIKDAQHNGTGQYSVTSGATRTLAVLVNYARANVSEIEGIFSAVEEPRTVEMPYLDAEVVDADEAKELKASIEGNRGRKLSPMDEAYYFKKLRELGWKPKDVAELYYGKDKANLTNQQQKISARILLTTLTPEMQQKVHLGKLTVSRATKWLKEREKGGTPADPKETPGQGERAKVPSVKQVGILLSATKPSDIEDEDVKARFGKGELWKLISQSADVRKFLALCAKSKFETMDQLKARIDSEKAAAKEAKASGKGKPEGEEAGEEPAAE